MKPYKSVAKYSMKQYFLLLKKAAELEDLDVILQILTNMEIKYEQILFRFRKLVKMLDLPVEEATQMGFEQQQNYIKNISSQNIEKLISTLGWVLTKSSMNQEQSSMNQEQALEQSLKNQEQSLKNQEQSQQLLKSHSMQLANLILRMRDSGMSNTLILETIEEAEKMN